MNQMHVHKIAGRQTGQGMSEYIIVVALVAMAAIAVVGMFGGVVKGQFSNMAAALSGDGSGEAVESTRDDADADMTDFFD
jgi:Flp pilus assembly pilin Flp